MARKESYVGQLGLGAGTATDEQYRDPAEVHETPPPVNPAVEAQNALVKRLQSGNVPQDRSGVDGLVYEA